MDMSPGAVACFSSWLWEQTLMVLRLLVLVCCIKSLYLADQTVLAGPEFAIHDVATALPGVLVSRNPSRRVALPVSSHLHSSSRIDWPSPPLDHWCRHFTTRTIALLPPLRMGR